MATATLITIPVYQINSSAGLDRNLYPYGSSMAFAGASLQVQPNTGTTLQQLQVTQQGAPAPAGTALVYSKIRSTATGDTVFFSSLTVAQIVTLANA